MAENTNKNEFTWHQVTEKEKQDIQKQAEKIMQDFGGKLEKIKIKDNEHFSSTESSSGTREEGEPWKTEPEFRDILLANAPFVEDDSIVAEKAGWK